MSTNCVLIIAPEGDIHVAGVAEALARRRVAAECIDLASLTRGLRLTLSLDGSVGARVMTQNNHTIDLSEVRSIWWRRPRIPEEDSELDIKTQKFVRGEWSHFIEGLEAFTPPRWVNSAAASRLAELKAFQLVNARAEGLRVPLTRITNDPEAVKEFAEDGKNLIYKRVGPAPLPPTGTKPLLPSDLLRLGDLKNCPTLFQERIDAQFDIRVTVIGQSLYATEIDSQNGASPLDWRFDHSVKFREHVLDAETSNRLRALVRRLGLRYGAIDLRLTPGGEYVFLEINPSGQYLFIELLTGIPLSDRMAALLSGEGDTQDNPGLCESPQPKKRRMDDTSDETTALAKGTLLELYEQFPRLRDLSVVWGGIAVAEWVGGVSDIGSHNTHDIDLILDPHVADSYPQLRRSLIESQLYEHRTVAGLIIPYSFQRKGRPPRDMVSIDFQGPERGTSEDSEQLPGLMDIGDLKVMVIAGGDLALLHSITKKIKGVLPGGRCIEGEVRLAPPFFLVPVKATAFADRGLDAVSTAFRRNYKDAADLYALLKFSPETPGCLANSVKAYRSWPLIDKTVKSVVTYFAAPDAQGVDAVIDFVQPRVDEEDDLRRKVAEVASEYVRALDG
jgi:hypothetical protein